MGFINSTVVDYPVEEVFNVFIRTAKRDFPKFNLKNPIGCAVTKKVGTYSAKTGTLRIEITDFKRNEIYQITSVRDKMMYISTYSFEVVDGTKTKIVLEENEETPGAFQFVNVIIQKICFKKTIKRRFNTFIDGLELAIDKQREKVLKAQPKENMEVIDYAKDDSLEDDGTEVFEENNESNKEEEISIEIVDESK